VERRFFLMGSLGIGSAFASKGLASPNDTVRVACVGLRGQGKAHIAQYAGIPNVEVAALCDVDENILQQRLREFEEAGRKRPATFTDFRKLLDDKSVDAVSLATPNHWHTLQTIWACQAGKDVYVEKPLSHNIFESRQIVAAARKYSRIVQHGTGNRSVETMREAVRKLREGVIGDVYMARGLCFKWRDTIGRKPVEPVPPGVHYDLWTGPAPTRPFTRNRFHYNWHWFWDYGNGDFGNQGIHELDVCRWGLGVEYPTKISTMGGHFMFDDDQETPNTIVASYEFDKADKKKLIVFEVRHWISNREAGFGAEEGDANTIGNLFYGAGGYLAMNSSRYRTFLGKQQEQGPSGSEDKGSNFVNFISALRTRDASELNAPVQEGAVSCTLMHLGNISYRLGRTLNFDAATMSCVGDEEANQMFTRRYRDPFIVPEKV
jgi:predicted dehydrogenase